MKKMTTRLLAAALLFATTALPASPKVHNFEMWGGMDPTAKVWFLIGFTNGMFTGAVTALMTGSGSPYDEQVQQVARSCYFTRDSMSIEQMIAMIDKYYAANPEEWQVIIGAGVMKALRVAGAPCEGKSLVPGKVK